MMQSIYGLAWRNLRANRVRSALSLVAVALGVAITIVGSMVAASIREGILKSDELRVMMEGMINVMDPLLLVVGVMIMLAGGFLIFNSFSMAITRQRQQIGSLRALGMTRAQVLRVILVEALLLAVSGVALGLLVSPLLGKLIITLFKQIMGNLLAFGDVSPTLPVMLFAAGMGLVITLWSVLIPARRAARITPLEALREPTAAGIQAESRLQTLVGLLLAGGTLVLVVLTPPGDWAPFPLNQTLTLLLVGTWLIGTLLLMPAVIGLAAQLFRRVTPGGVRMTNAVSRLITDNFQRSRGRVTLTVVTLAFALLVLVSMTGFLEFFLRYGVAATFKTGSERQGMYVARINIAAGWGGIVARGLDSIMLSDDEVQATLKIAAGRAEVIPNYYVVVPELSFLGSAYFSYMVDPILLRGSDTMMTFMEGNWDTAMPILQNGCGVLVAPLVAAKNNAGLGDTITVTGLNGPLECTIAGIGTTPGGASIISDTLHDQLTAMNPVLVLVIPYAGTDAAALTTDLRALTTTYPEVSVSLVSGLLVVVDDAMGAMRIALNGLLLLATFAAAFGVVNTMMISVEERRREIGLLRAVGTTQRQMRRIILGEALLMGVVGGVTGLVAGCGTVLIIVLTYGFHSFGFATDLWQGAMGALQPAFITGIVGLIGAPLIAALAAWIPARRILRASTVETLALQ